MSDKLGFYIHIPFCRSKCAYCDFYSGKASEDEYDVYVNDLKGKIKYWSEKTDKALTSVYFGGGTPSVLGTDRLCGILDCVKSFFKLSDDPEITVEINPESGKTLDFYKLKEHGFNRLSIGLQSSIEKELKALGRIHTLDDVKVTVCKAKSGGFDNFSLDLMLGIPYQTQESLKSSIDFCSDCGVTHISAYILKLEEGTRFYKNKDKLDLPDEDAQAELYLFAVSYLEKLGYKQYEISNFAKPGFESRHNTSYWTLDDYIGIGPSAHSFFEGKRFYYDRNMADFINNKTISDGFGGGEDEFIMLSLRLKSGLSFEEYQKRYNKPFPESLIKAINKYVRLGLMERTGSSAGFTPKGYLVSNSIISELI